MKKIFFVCLILILIFTISFNVFAQTPEDYVYSGNAKYYLGNIKKALGYWLPITPAIGVAK